MLRNFVADADLLEYYPAITDYLPDGTTSYATQISEAFNLVLNDLRAKGIDSRSVMTPIDLLRPDSTTGEANALTSATETTATSHLHVTATEGFRRLVINCTAYSGSAKTVTLYGSNDQGINSVTEPTNWATVKAMTVSATGETTGIFENQYLYYRIVSTVPDGSVTYTASIVETNVDTWIVYKALWLIFTYFAKLPDDIWSERAKKYDGLYSSVMAGYKFTYDAEHDNKIDPAEELKSGQRRMGRK